MPDSFVHLHNHSEYSLLDGATRIDAMVKRAKDLGMPAIALTDHGSMFGAIEFYKAAKKVGIKPIIGCELYVASGALDDRTTKNQSYFHQLAIALNYEGYINLCKLSSIGHLKGFYYRPRVDFKTLVEHNKGLYLTSSCLKGMVPRACLDHGIDAGRKVLHQFLEVFGRDRFAIEIQDHGIDEQLQVNPMLIELAREADVRIIATNDNHYLCRDDAPIQDALVCISTGKTLSDPARMKFDNPEFYIKTREEMEERFGSLPESLTSTLHIADMCDLDLQLGKFRLPRYDPPTSESPVDYLNRLVDEGARRLYPNPLPTAVTERLAYELGVIHKAGYTAYFLIVWDFIHHARSQGIAVGPGRGSAAGSLVAYCLGITELDPLEHGLLFERFLNPDRVSPPDIDVDFCFERRPEVIEYVRQKYGTDRVAQIITFGTLGAKAALRDAGRVLGRPLADADRLAKLIPEKPGITLKDSMKEAPELGAALAQEPALQGIWKLAEGIEGAVRNCSIHAAGVIIADQSLTNYAPLYKATNDDTICTQYSMGDCEAIGLLKMDFLGIKNLTIIQRVMTEVLRSRNIVIDWLKIPMDDPASYALLCEGDTEGIFQLESDGMTGLVKRLRPTNFADITALLALYRPGPLQSGMADTYVDCKHGRKPVQYDHPALEPILKETYGVILYQEQVMNIAKVFSGFTLGQADVLRKAMGKKNAELMAEQEAKFVAGAVKTTGVEESLAKHVWNQIVTFAGYGFNKSHSAAYAVVTFRTAYLKAHFPVEFMAALMTNEINANAKTNKMATYVHACRERKIPIHSPDVNQSHAYFTVENCEAIRFGLAAVKGVGVAAIDALVAEREKNGPFRSVSDFLQRMPHGLLNARVIESLARIGAFDSLGSHRAQVIAALPAAIETAARHQRDLALGQGSLFDDFAEPAPAPAAAASARPGASGATATPSADQFPEVPRWPLTQQLAEEKALLGFYLSGHPLDRFRVDVTSFSQFPSSKIAKLCDDQEVLWLGMLLSVTPKIDKNKRTWAVGLAEDFEGSIELKFWPRTYEAVRELLVPDTLLAVRGKVSRWNENVQLAVEEAWPIEDYRRRAARCVEIEWESPKVSADAIRTLRAVAQAYRGRVPVNVLVRQPNIGAVRFADKSLKVALSSDCLERLQTLEGEPRIRFAMS